MTKVIESSAKRFKDIPEFGFIYSPETGGGIMALNKKELQFCLNGVRELADFFMVIFGRIDESDFCRLMPQDTRAMAFAPDLRILNMGRFMIHFENDELDRFREYLKSKILSDLDIRSALGDRLLT